MIFLGKAAAALRAPASVQALAAVVFALAFALDLAPRRASLALVAALGGARHRLRRDAVRRVAARTRYREVMLPLLLLPLLVPVLLGAVRATAALLEGGRSRGRRSGC